MNLLLFFGGLLAGLVVMAVIAWAIVSHHFNKFAVALLKTRWYR